jgi:hypothetical protein
MVIGFGVIEGIDLSRNDDNRLKALAEVVSIDAWHDELSPDNCKVDLYADVVFSTGRLGGEAASQVRFRLSVKRAELVLIIPELEPFKVEKPSVARLDQGMKLKHSVSQATSVKESLSGGMKIGAGTKGATASANVGAEAKRERKRNETLVGSREVASIKATYRLHNADNSSCWTFEPGIGPILEGRPWDPSSTPLLKLVDTRQDRSNSIPPTARFEIRCRREDFEITDIHLKDETFMWRRGKKIRMKAAEAYIRNQLAEAGLTAGDLKEPFAIIKLGQIVVSNG